MSMPISIFISFSLHFIISLHHKKQPPHCRGGANPRRIIRQRWGGAPIYRFRKHTMASYNRASFAGVLKPCASAASVCSSMTLPARVMATANRALWSVGGDKLCPPVARVQDLRLRFFPFPFWASKSRISCSYFWIFSSSAALSFFSKEMAW